MLARASRLVSADDYRSTLRRGRRSGTGNLVVSARSTSATSPARFGFIVTRKVGNAVNRNRIRRRLRAIARELVDGGFTGQDVVVRVLPGASEASWAQLRTELSSALGPEPAKEGAR